MRIESDVEKLMEHAWEDLFDLANDGTPVRIEIHPGEPGGRSSLLFWGDTEGKELAILQSDDVNDGIRRVWLLGEELEKLRGFLK